MISVKVPGKLYIAGEYAVVEAGEPAVLATVNTYIKLDIESNSNRREIFDDSGSWVSVSARPAGELLDDTKASNFQYPLNAILIIEQIAAQRGIDVGGYKITISNELSAQGLKYGLGSSAAVVMAVICAFDKYLGLNLSPLERFKAGAITSYRLNSRGSGGDLAASAFTGWIGYWSYSRAWLGEQIYKVSPAELIKMDWPKLKIRRLVPPDDLRLHIGWTGSPASTPALVRSVHKHPERGNGVYRNFLSTSNEIVSQMIDQFDKANLVGIQQCIKRARANLNVLGEAMDITFETPLLKKLADIAESCGYAGKLSGAGGGDCGIAIASKDDDVSSMIESWQQSEITYLPISSGDLA